MIIEPCLETLTEALLAQDRGAHQIELCADLTNDGLTPFPAVVQACLAQLQIEVKVMIRHRAGDFIYTPEDIEIMKETIIQMKDLAVQHIVLGATTINNELNLDQIAALRDAAGDMKITIHKAIDSCTDPVEATRQLRQLGGIDSILTSGGALTAALGAETIRQMHAEAAGEINIIAAGKITTDNLQQLDRELGTGYYHGKLILGDLKTQ